MRAYLDPVHPGNLEEGLNRRGVRDIDDSVETATQQRRDSDATATRRLNEVETRAKL